MTKKEQAEAFLNRMLTIPNEVNQKQDQAYNLKPFDGPLDGISREEFVAIIADLIENDEDTSYDPIGDILSIGDSHFDVLDSGLARIPI